MEFFFFRLLFVLLSDRACIYLIDDVLTSFLVESPTILNQIRPINSLEWEVVNSPPSFVYEITFATSDLCILQY
jgi:hypothetical protein